MGKCYKETLKCQQCGKPFTYYYKGKLHRKFCSKVCEGNFKRGRSIGKYDEDRVISMVKGKRDAYIKRHADLYSTIDKDIVEKTLKEQYIRTYEQLAYAINFDMSKRINAKLIKYFCEENNLSNLFVSYDLPPCFTHMNADAISWYKGIIKASQSWVDFKIKFSENPFNFPLIAGSHDLLILFCKYVNFEFEKFKLSSSISKDTVPEMLFELLLKKYDVEYVKQVVLKRDELYFQKNNSVPRHKFYKPDFIINKSIIVEVNGDYWHGNERVYKVLDEKQIEGKQNDLKKYKWYLDKGYKYYIIWEYDLRRKSSYKEIENFVRRIKDEHNYKKIDF